MSELHQFGERKGADRQSEEGYILLAVLFLVVLVLIGLAVAAPQIARSIQRDKEIELVHRGEEYKRAIKLYYRKFGAYPSSIDQLLNTNNIRFLRKRYTDPITGKDDWRLIYYGQAKVPPLGLFGQPLALVAGPTTGGPLGGPTGAPADQSGQTGTVTVDQPSDNSGSNSSDSGDNNSNNANSGENAANNPSVTITGAAPTPSGTAPGTAAPGSGPGGANGAGGNTTGAFGSTLGGGPIVGVGIPSTKASLIEYKKQKQYNKWEFVYNPIEDTLAAGVAGGNTTTVNGTNGTTPGTTTPGTTTGTTGVGVTPMNGGIGTSSGTGNTGGSSPDQQQ